MFQVPPVRTAVIGVGAFGQNHARVYSQLPDVELIAVVDQDAGRAQEVAKQFDCKALTDHAEVLESAQAVSLAVPTALHADLGVELLEAGLDVLVEKPIAADLAGSDRLIDAAAGNGRILQVGHLERFNPAVEAALELADLPLFFEVHRLNQFSPRSLDVDVVLDLMIHDLDIVLALSKSPISRIEAAGVPVMSTKADISSVRLVFENGCVANLTASRVSTEKVRKLRFFQPRQYVSVDYARQDGVTIRLDDQNRPQFQQIRPAREEPLTRQLAAFIESVRTRTPPLVDGAAAKSALEAALRIRAEMERHAAIVDATMKSRTQ